jgi:hypothetical protein
MLFESKKLCDSTWVQLTEWGEECRIKGDAIGYGRWTEVDPSAGAWLEHKYCCFSDYSGGSVERSNVKWLLEMCEKEKLGDEDYLHIYGEYGTQTILLRGSIESEDIIEAVEGLESYPIIDEDLMSEIENAAQDEAWESWAETDFRREIEKRAGCAIAEDFDLYDFFRKAMEGANEYWCEETGGGQYIDLKKIVDYVFSNWGLDNTASLPEFDLPDEELATFSFFPVEGGGPRVIEIRYRPETLVSEAVYPELPPELPVEWAMGQLERTIEDNEIVVENGRWVFK